MELGRRKVLKLQRRQLATTLVVVVSLTAAVLVCQCKVHYLKRQTNTASKHERSPKQQRCHPFHQGAIARVTRLSKGGNVGDGRRCCGGGGTGSRFGL